MTTPVSTYLTEQGVAHRLFRHPGSVTSLEQAAAERGQRPEQVVRSILFRLAAERYAMVLVAGPSQVAWKALRQVVGQNRLTMAGSDEVLAVTGYPIGAVNPFGLPTPMPIYIDDGVVAEEGNDHHSFGGGPGAAAARRGHRPLSGRSCMNSPVASGA
jgi:prolyl-tRNA editing enzyme YbaK/EbsC (Cys-tRNA(Pro) deacylase)